MKRKVTKIVFRFLIWLLVLLVTLPALGYIVVKSPAVQTWVIGRITSYFSAQWGTTVRIDRVDVELFSHLILEGVYVEDLQHDTLLYAHKLKADISVFDRDSQRVVVDELLFEKATIHLSWMEQDSAPNYQFLIDAFASGDTTPSTDSSVWDIRFRELALQNIHFTYRTRSSKQAAPFIDFADLSVHDLQGRISDIHMEADTALFRIDELHFSEKSGFRLHDLSGLMALSSSQLRAEDLKIKSTGTEVLADLVFRYDQWSDFNDFINKIRFKGSFRPSKISMKDIAYFAEELTGLDQLVLLQGDFSGKVSDFKGRNVQLKLGELTTFAGNIDMTGLPDIDQTYMSFDAKELHTSRAGIEAVPLPPFKERRFIELPPNIGQFGNIHFKGNFSGYYYDFVSYGKFSTALGHFSTDLSMKQGEDGKTAYHGRFTTRDFHLGRFLEQEKILGQVTLDADVDGKGLSKSDASLQVSGKVSSLECYGYNYHDISLNGRLARNVFDGFLQAEDENLKMKFNGFMDFSRSPVQVNFATVVNKANLDRLNLAPSGNYAGLTGELTAEVTGNNLNDATGRVKVKDLVYLKDKEVYDFKDIGLMITEDKGLKTIELQSPLMEARAYGRLIPLEIVPALRELMAGYLPAVFGKEEKKEKEGGASRSAQDFVFSATIRQPDVLTEAFLPDLKLAASSSWSGHFSPGQKTLTIDADFPSLTYLGYQFRSLKVNIAPEGERFSLKTSSQRLMLADSAWIDNVELNALAESDTVLYHLKWKNQTRQRYEGDLPGFLAFSKHPFLRAKFLPSYIVIADSTWNLDDGNEIVLDSSFIGVRHMNISSAQQKIRLEGNISKVKEDQLYLLLENFSLANFNSVLKGTGLNLYGTISGNTSISNVYDKPVFGSSLEVTDLALNKELLGSGTLVSVYESKNDLIHFNGRLAREDAGEVSFTGDYYPSKKKESLTADATVRNFRLAFFEPFTKGLVSDLQGTAGAELKINGTPANPEVSGKILADVSKMHVDYLGTDYHFKGEFTAEPNAFDFGGLEIFDENENKAQVVNGKVFHDNFRKFQLDIDLNAKKFLALNTTEQDNSIYYGKFFATGIANVFGYLDNINLSATVKSDKARNALGKNEYSQLFIPLSGSEEVSENGFITFVRNDSAGTAKPPKYKVSTTGFTMDFKLEPTPDAQVQLIFDEKVGDIIKAAGTGNIRMLIDEFGEFKMYGDYEVEDGDYLFTLKNVVNKKFRLEKGGVIHWAGNPEEAELNMSAIYQLRTSLTPLFLEHEQTEQIRKRYPVDLVMSLSGKLLEPSVAFDVRLPTVDDFTRQQAYEKFKHGESEINKQVFSLLFTNSFTVPPFQQGESAGGPGAGTVTSTEMLSNQLSNWLSQISNDFDVGMHYRPGDEVNKGEVELALSTQLFNDKMTIDGTVANNSNSSTSQNASAVVGDINVEYKLTEDGKLRAKAFNKTNEGDILNTQKGPYTQGLGIFYREEFETFREFFKKIFKKKETK